MSLFAFNLYKQINLFTKHIFANKDITTYYYIYSCFVWLSPFGPSWCYARWGSCLPFLAILATRRGKPPPALEAACQISPARLLPSPGSLLAVLHPLVGILHPGHRQGARTSLLSAAGTRRRNPSFKGIKMKGYCSIYQLFKISSWVALYKVLWIEIS